MSSSDAKKVLITGGSGFIGTNLMAALQGGYPDILNLDQKPPLDSAHARFWRRGDILDAQGLLGAFQEFKPTHVVHLAARCDCDEKTTVEDGYQANTLGTANVLEAIKATSSVRRTVITSSQFVFNKKGLLPQSDEDYAPRTVYGQSKIVTEQLTRRANLSCCWTLIRPTNVWGPWHIRHTQQFFRILKAGLYLHPGNAKVMRSYAFVGNVVDQIRKILEVEESRVNKRVLYLGDPSLNLLDWVNGFSLALKGKPVKIIPQALMKTLALGGDLISKINRKDFFISSSRLRSMTDPYLTPMEKTFEAIGPNAIGLEEGIRQTVEWLQRFETMDQKVIGRRAATA